MTDTDLDSVPFLPWRGSSYDTVGFDGLRLLVVGESHYYPGTPPVPLRDFTRYAVRTWGMPNHGTARLFTIVQRAVVRATNGQKTSREQFWNSIAFYNYLGILFSHPRQEVPADAWSTAATNFAKVLKELTPSCVLVLGKESLRYMERDGITHAVAGGDLVSSGAWTKPIPFADVTHPSGRGFRYSTACASIKSLLDRTKAERPAS